MAPMKKLKFLLSLIMRENAYQRQHASQAEEVARGLGVDIKIQYANNDAITQSEQLLNTIHSSSHDSSHDSPPDGIICAPVGTTLAHVARSAAGAGIAWAVLNRDCDYMAELRLNYSVPIFSVSVDQSEMGRIQGRQIAALLPQGGLVLYILGPSGSPIVEYRQSCMKSTKPANVQVRTLSGNWSEQSAYKAVAAWLQLRTSRITPVNLVAGQCDDMAMGARRAFEDHCRDEERERWTSLPYIGCDGCREAGQQWVRRTLLAATVINPPTAGIALEMMARAIEAKTQPIERTIVAPSSFPVIEKLAGTVLRANQGVS